MRYYFFLAGVFCLSLTCRGATAPPASSLTTAQLISRLTAAIHNLGSIRCNAEARERVGTKIAPDYTAMKIAYNPYRVYLKNRKGVEVLYVTGQNDNDAWVYPAAFPYVTLSLDPNGSLMRKGQHHTVLQAGFGMIADLLNGPDGRAESVFTRSFHYTGDSTAQGQPCYVLRSDYPQFRYVAYRVGKNESIASVAARFGCGEYRIIERNNLSVDSKLTEGQELQVPNAYGRRVVVVVNAKTYLPASVTVYDDRGLYEKYSFLDVVANQPIPAAEFSKDYKGYKL
ncbi:LysM peptidoglycan-binding domain-containing protein [Hymenobacter cheonanensis]|uniref:LysM peptidoglycan-binding domain-containing protein n=1 Tax=Hymenobacter sp. CA2-7 TaxID=3063993 RepID=UPI00271272F4|nr:DUF1571 domain-containing protein [Hymenobacter sp. CA2-7]MDO7887325.1 DUF1571 domain-containing protein [Hymenobacter sp. CA2-7]